MAKETIKVTANQGKENEVSANIVVEIPDTLKDLVAVFSEPVVVAKLRQKIHIDAVNCARTKLVAGTKPADVVAFMATWKPGVVGPKMSAEDKALNSFMKLSPEERKAALSKLRDLVK
jgi:hypothetical protein